MSKKKVKDLVVFDCPDCKAKQSIIQPYFICKKCKQEFGISIFAGKKELVLIKVESPF